MSPHSSRLPRKPTSLAATLSVAIAALSALGLAGPVARADEPLQERFEKVVDVAGLARVRVQNVNGPVRVTSWDKSSVRVIAVKKARGSRAAEALKETEIRIVRTGTSLDVETIQPKQVRFLGLFSFGDLRKAEVSYEVQLPGTVAVEVETVNGRVSAEGRMGSLTLNTVNGSVKVEAQTGPVHANAVNGSVEVTFAGPLRTSDLETVNGSVSVTCARDSSIRYELQTVNGRIRSDFAEVTVEGKWGPKEARGSINNGRERLAAETVNGEVRLLADSSAPGPGIR